MAGTSNIIPSVASADFPGCALSCTTLIYAQQLCEPPTQPATNQLTYDTCFCNSVQLAPLVTTPDALCTAECTIQSDRQILQQWFNGFCAQVRQGIDPVAARTATTTTVATATQATVTQTGNPATTSLAGPTGTSAASSSSASNQSWISGHWKYIVMIIVIALGLAVIAILAVCWKRRHRKKLAANRARASGFNYDAEKRSSKTRDLNRSATPDLWGPHQAQHASQGYLYNTHDLRGVEGPKSGPRLSKFMERQVVDSDAPTSSSTLTSQRSSQRARPADLERNARMIGAADRRSKSQKGSHRVSVNEKGIDPLPRSRSKSRSRRRRNSDPARASR